MAEHTNNYVGYSKWGRKTGCCRYSLLLQVGLQSSVEKTGNNVKIKSNDIEEYIYTLCIFDIESIIAELVSFKEENLHIRKTSNAVHVLVTAAFLANLLAAFFFFSFPIPCEAFKGSVDSKPSFVEDRQHALPAAGGPDPLQQAEGGGGGVGQLLCCVGAF